MWRAFCNAINELPASAKLHKALLRDLKTKMGSLADPSGLRTQSERKTLKHPHVTHFSGSVVNEEMAVFIVVRYARPRVGRMAVEIVTYRRVECAINSFTSYTSRSKDDVILVL